MQYRIHLFVFLFLRVVLSSPIQGSSGIRYGFNNAYEGFFIPLTEDVAVWKEETSKAEFVISFVVVVVVLRRLKDNYYMKRIVGY